MFNEALAHEPQIASAAIQPTPIHFDYVDSDEATAIAVRCNHDRFIGVTIPEIEGIWTACSTLAAYPQLPGLLGLDGDDRSRQSLAGILFRLQLISVFCHEYAHHLNGDVAASALFIEDGEPMQGNIQSQTRELHADGIAISFCLRLILGPDERKHILQAVGREPLDEARQDELLITLLIVAIGARMYRRIPVELDETGAYQATHPAAAARMNYVMRDLQQWCAKSRARLEPFITLALFQSLMSGIDQSLADGQNQRWAQQNAFLQSPRGAAYMSALHAALNKRLEERS